jgi:hypothetical protein
MAAIGLGSNCAARSNPDAPTSKAFACCVYLGVIEVNPTSRWAKVLKGCCWKNAFWPRRHWRRRRRVVIQGRPRLEAKKLLFGRAALRIRRPGTDIMIFFRRKIGEKIGVFDSKQIYILQKFDSNFLRKPFFSPKMGENCRKLWS